MCGTQARPLKEEYFCPWSKGTRIQEMQDAVWKSCEFLISCPVVPDLWQAVDHEMKVCFDLTGVGLPCGVALLQTSN